MAFIASKCVYAEKLNIFYMAEEDAAKNVCTMETSQ